MATPNQSMGNLPGQGGDDKTNFDLTKMDLIKLFDQEDSVRIIKDPIFEIDGHIFFATVLKEKVEVTTQTDDQNPSPAPVEVKNENAFYGVRSGIGLSPLSSITNKRDVITDFTTHKSEGVKYRVESFSRIQSKNQHDAILYCGRDVVKRGSLDFLRPGIASYSLPQRVGDDPQESIKNKIQYYVKLGNELEYIIATCFVLGTYLFPLFTCFGYLIISGEKGAGKGTFLDILYRTCWNPSSKLFTVTESTLFRIIETQKPTLLIDEYHRAVQNEINGIGIISIVEGGYDKGGAVPRTDKQPDGSFKVVEHPIYCPKVLVTRRPVEADDKGIKITLPKVTGDVIYSKRKIELDRDSFFETIRRNIMEWIVRHDIKVLEAYKTIEPTYKLGGRDFQVWAPILAIAKIAFPKRYNDLFKFAEESVSNKLSNGTEKETLILQALHYLYSDDKLEDGGTAIPQVESYKVTNNEINNALIDLELIENEYEKVHHNTIKSALENLKILGRHKKVYYLKKDKLITLFKERGFIKVNNPDRAVNHEGKDEDLKAAAANPENPGSLDASEKLAQEQFQNEKMVKEVADKRKTHDVPPGDELPEEPKPHLKPVTSEPNYEEMSTDQLSDLTGIGDKKASNELERRQEEMGS
jgi:hypothetical protein